MATAGHGSLERGFLATVLGLGLCAWVAVTLAEFGLLQPALFVPAGLAATGVAAVFCRRGTAFAGGAFGSAQGFIAACLVVVCAAVFFPPYETFVWASDSTVYLGLGPEIARNDGFELDDPLLAEIEMPARAEIFRNRAGLDATGLHVRLPGGYGIPAIEEPTVVAGFSPVFPALLAVVYDLLGVRAMPWVAPAFAILSMLALFLVGCRVAGLVAGAGATVLAAASLPQMWFARFPMPEIVVELFVLSALLALSISLASGQPRWGALAGALLGIAALGRFELLAIIAITWMAFVGVLMACTGRGPRPTYLWMAAAFGAFALHAALHYLLLPTHYTLFVRQQIASNYAVRTVLELGWGRFGAVLALVGIAAAVALSRSGGGLRANLSRRRMWGTMMALAVAAYFANDGSAPNLVGNPVGLRAGLAESARWLGWYFGWPLGITLAAASVPAMRRRRGEAPGGAGRETLAFASVLVLVALLHVHRAPDTDEHIWAMRRFVPAVIPGLALLSSSLTVIALRPLGRRRGPLVAATVLAVVALGVAIPSFAILGEPLWEGSFQVVSDLAELVPEGAVVVVSNDLAGTHLATALNYIHGVRTIVLRPILPTPTLLGDLVSGWIEDGRPVFLIAGDDVFSFYAPDLSLVEVDRRVLSVPVLERTTGRPPQRIVSERAPLTVARLFSRDAAATTIDIGDPADDSFFQLFGFFGQESDPRQVDPSFRWTTASARMLVPPVRAVRLSVSGARPDGVPVARLSVAVDGVLVLDRLEISDDTMEVLIDLPAAELAGPRNLVFTTTPFSPAAAGFSADERQLGVRVYGVELLGAGGQ